MKQQSSSSVRLDNSEFKYPRAPQVTARRGVDCGVNIMPSFAVITGSKEDKGPSGNQTLTLVRVCKEDGDKNGSVHRWIERTADMLCAQWPRGGPVATYQSKLIHGYNRYCEYYGLPCSYILIQGVESPDPCVIGHGRLTECFESAGGNAAAATYILIDPAARGKGMGRHLMHLLETEARRIGYHYIYLWTKTAIEFYRKIGYKECHRVSLKRACLKKLEARQVESIEALLLKRSQQAAAYNKSTTSTAAPLTKKPETLLLLDADDGNDLPDIWLRKRLVEHVGSVEISMESRLEELKQAVDDENRLGPSLKWYYHLQSLPWQAQIGPSCGLAALRMVRELFWSKESGGRDQQLPSLLQEAQERGFTGDGEVFNANHLVEIAEKVCGIQCEMLSTRNLALEKVLGILNDGGVFILPYDSNARTRLPGFLSGRKAHYGVIVGVLIGVPDTNAKDAELQLLSNSDWRKVAASASRNSSVLLLVQHSLCSELSIASWSDFLASNQQLHCVDEQKFGCKDLDLKNRLVACRGLQPGSTME